MSDQDETKPKSVAFDFESFPTDTLFYDRREGRERRTRGPNGHITVPVDKVPTPPPAPTTPKPAPERREKKERRRRIDPTTFEKQYTDDELEFMNAMQRFKVQSGKSFPAHGEVLKVAFALGYRKVVHDDIDTHDPEFPENGLADDPPADHPNGSPPVDDLGIASAFESE